MRLHVIAFVSLLAATPAVLHAQRFYALGVTDQDGATFFAALQKAVNANDRAAIVHMVNYPLHVNHAQTQHRLIDSPAQLLRQYDAVFTPAVRRSIAADKLATLFISDGGVAIGRGIVWLNSVCTRSHPPVCHLGIGSVNLP